MAHNSTENLIQSDSSTSTDELNNGSHSRSLEKVSKKMFHKKKTAFVGSNSVASPSSSVQSSPQQHQVIVVGTADVHEPPKPLPRKNLMTTRIDSMGTKRKPSVNVDDVLELSVSGESESNNGDGKVRDQNREDIELYEIKSRSESSGARSDKMEESKMFFARSRKNTIVTNLDEVSVKSSEDANESFGDDRKPLPKPRQFVQTQFEIVHERQPKIIKETPEKARQDKKTSNSESEASTETESHTINVKKAKQVSEEMEEVVQGENTLAGNLIERLIGIYIHSSSELKYDYNIYRPMVRCSIVDATTGQLLQHQKTNGTLQIDQKNIIQPISTKGCHFASS
ncbi:hypothetical protein Bhyg_00928, partial [Pseudolycoriella hygida]